ncbi:cell division protein FtsK [Actinomadura sp. KC06]|uniref:cell division protein FtsK n=1 Tax=Actinomadura sp. KC06 TaxID=2530369 RepID=UPI00104D53DC|nr:cell division protein FtsK [Actinomadura sp. KC06]TDD27354.1 cell division protein FtsK [Actinomadura sp. KC06]
MPVDLDEEPAPGPQAPEKQPPSTGVGEDGDVLEGVVVRADLPALLPDWVRDWEIAKARADVRARRAAYKAAFHALRTPRYLWRFGWGGGVGLYRGSRALADWITLGESRDLRIHAAGQAEYKVYLDLLHARNDHVRIRGIIAGGTATAVTAGVVAQALLLPHPVLWVEGLLAWAVAAWHGGPEDETGFLDEVDVPVRLDLNVEDINAAFRAVGLLKGKDEDEDAPRLVFVRRPQKDGAGWSTLFDLPKGSGKSAADALKLRDKIAAELGVDEIQLDMRRVRTPQGGHAGRISMWVCDEDPYLQDQPTPSPLVKADSWSLWDPIPFGRDARHNRIGLSIMWQSMFFGGLPRRGKTAAQRLLSAAGALDATVRHWLADGKGGADWRPMRRLAHRMVLGAEPDAVRALEDMLDEVIADMEATYRKLGSIPTHLAPDGKLTPQLVKRYGLYLNLITIDELQEYLTAISSKERREALVDRLCRIARRGPAAGYILNAASQRPDADSVPTRLRETISQRYSTQVIDRASSDMVLGKGKAAQGADASILSEDHVGVGVLVTGPSNFVTVLTDYTTVPEFAEICERGRALRLAAATLSGDAADDVLAGEGQDVIPEALADALTVMRHANRMHTTTLLNQLVNLAEDVYGNWDADRLAEELTAAGVDRSTTQVKIDGVNRNGWHKADLIAAAEMYGGAP